MVFVKGEKGMFSGRRHTKESREKMRLSHLGVPRYGDPANWKCKEETKRKISEAKKGQRGNPATEFKKGMTPWNKGKKTGIAPWLGKKRLHMTGDKHPMWKGGLTLEIYPTEWNERLKEEVRKRDHYHCMLCDYVWKEEDRKPHVHHIDYNKKNCNINNLVTLCRFCHIKTSRNRDYWWRVLRRINYIELGKETERITDVVELEVY